MESDQAPTELELAPDESNYVRWPNAGAPDAGKALYLNHPDHGWLPILDQYTNIETDLVLIVLGNPTTGAYLTTYETFYSNTEDLIFDSKTIETILPDPDRRADELTAADQIVAPFPSSTPGHSNLPDDP